MTVQASITLSTRDLHERSWSQDGLHFAHPLSPLFASYMVPAMTEGTRRAMACMKAPIRQFISKIHHGYYYQSVVPAPGDPEAVLREHRALVEPRLGRQQALFAEVVANEIWPLHQEIDRLTRSMVSATVAISGLERLAEIYTRFWDLHFQIVLPRNLAGMAFEQTYQAAFPERDPMTAYNLLVGTMNKSLEQDRALWKLVDLAKRHPTVLEAFAAERVHPRLLANPDTGPFRQALAEYLDIYGWRSVYVHEFLYEAWHENPEYCLTVLKGYLQQSFDFDRHWQNVIAQRDTAAQAMLAEVADPQLRSALIATYENALECWSIDEDHHFYIDAMLPARSRQMMLKIADLLLEQKIIRTRRDVFFFYLDELVATLQGNVVAQLAETLAEREQTLARQQAETPPPQLGDAGEGERPSADFVTVRVFGMGSPSLEGATREVRGFAASPGRHVGPVRIIRGPEEFFKVQPGDVLVCRNTAPAWTGLFATAGAVITETGGILSHAATVAREYQIPCIVGTREATHVFRDGDRVAVDGTTGVAIADG